MRSFEEAERYVHSFTRFGSQLGLGRMRRLLALLGNPQDQLRFVHVAGTNGKGSTARMTAGVLEAAGYRTGLYISPFVIAFRERFQVNGQWITEEEFTALVEEIDPFVHQLAAEGEQVTEFEMVTAVGFLFFHRRKCDIVVLEVGLGGRFDATNVISTPECGIIASISLDHTAILGDTLSQIAFEKAGIIKENTDLIAYGLLPPEAMEVLYRRCAETGSRLIQPNPAAAEILRCDMDGSSFLYGGEEYRLALVGRHQIYNALSVIEGARVLMKKGYRISEEQLKQGIASARFPSRFEVVDRDPLVILDGAHNPEAARSLAQTLADLPAAPKVAVMAMMSDKDCESVLRAVGGQCSAILTVPVTENPRALSPEELAERARRFCQNTEYFHSCAAALDRAQVLAGRQGAVIVCGSFYMTSEMRQLFPAGGVKPLQSAE